VRKPKSPQKEVRITHLELDEAIAELRDSFLKQEQAAKAFRREILTGNKKTSKKARMNKEDILYVILAGASVLVVALFLVGLIVS
jgi:hypothetical protein